MYRAQLHIMDIWPAVGKIVVRLSKSTQCQQSGDGEVEGKKSCTNRHVIRICVRSATTFIILSRIKVENSLLVCICISWDCFFSLPTLKYLSKKRALNG